MARAQIPPGIEAPYRLPPPWACGTDEPQSEPSTGAGATDPPCPHACQTTEAAKPFWALYPLVTPFPRPGNFYTPPSGLGYYSLLDLLKDNERQTAPKFPYGPISITPFSFFDADFRYLDDPKNKQYDWLDFTKREHFRDDWMFSVGGEERIRYMNEVDSRLTGKDNVYELLRTRVYGDLWYRDVFRVYVEYIDAQIFDNELPPALIDVNRSDLLNLFADLKLGELDGDPVYVRGGRQELLYGSERLISPPDWSNTRRTFEGVKGFWHSEKLDIDTFWVQPVIVDPTHFDSTDEHQNFEGLWTTYRPCQSRSVDLYYLDLDNSNHVALGEYHDRGGFNVSTLGSRYAGDYHNILWDGEAMCQFGSWANQVTAAAAATAGGGYHFTDYPLNPQFWVYFDWAEGDPHPGTGAVHRTFNQLFPFGHYYFGSIDLVGRQNIDDLSLHLALNPTKWITTGVQYHVLHLDSPRDALYNSAGVPTRIDPTGRAGTDVGNILMFFTNFHLSPHQDIYILYSKLYAGEFINKTGPPGSPDLFALQYSFKW
jgi:hypothetical protein